MTSASWSPSSELTAETLSSIRAAGAVKELTVSKVFIPYEKFRSVHCFRFFNTDPKNWNLFMFPYESKKLRKEINSEHVASNAADISALIGEGGAEYLDFATGEVATQAEIKFSRSSNLNTLYVFFYRIVRPSDARFDFEHRDVEFSNANETKVYFETHAAEFASNVPGVVLEVINASG